MAAGMAQLVTPPAHLTDENSRRIYMTEAALAFYAMGKIGRIVSSYRRSMVPSDDSWHDLEVYAAMAAKIRSTGIWMEE